jgi:SAM-dependent methyltransferase
MVKIDGIFDEAIDLARVQVSGPVAAIRRAYLDHHGEAAKGSGFYSRWDWARITVAFDRIAKGGRVLDVGVGSGQLVNLFASSNAFSSVVGVDVKTHSKFLRLTDAFEMQEMNVARLKFEDASFDAVVCMEVLEHVDPRTFEAGLSELRRVCRGHLLTTVPFEEPEPLPSYHKQRFDRGRIEALWPSATRTRLDRPNVAWALMEERLG